MAEIERLAHDKRFVQVQFSGRRRSRWAAASTGRSTRPAAKHGLHVMSHAFGSYGHPITGTGWPSFYIEDHVGPAQAMQANIMCLVTEGVFETFRR